MAIHLYLHPESPQSRLIHQAGELVRHSGVIIYPTATGYALGCLLGDKEGENKLRSIRGLSPSHDLTVLCRDLSQVGQYALLHNVAFKVLKRILPGAFTFILPPGPDIPRRLFTKRRDEIGFRIADHPAAVALLDELGSPLLTSSLQLPEDSELLSDPDDIIHLFGSQVACFLDVGAINPTQTTVLDLTTDIPKVLRQGTGIFE